MSARYLLGMIKRYWLLPWVAFAPVLLGQANTASQNVQGAARGLEQLRSARAVRADRAPKLDGTLNDPLWQQASPANDLLQRLQKDDVFDALRLPWSELMDASRFIGRAPEQTDRFIDCVIEPVRLRFAGRLRQKVELKV